MARRRELLGWLEVERLIDHLLPQFQGEYVAMVIITRGGIVPGGMLSELLGLTHVLTAAVDFPFEDRRQEAKLLAWPQFIQFPEDQQIVGRRVLVVDDVWGSGRTITAAQNRGSAPRGQAPPRRRGRVADGGHRLA